MLNKVTLIEDEDEVIVLATDIVNCQIVCTIVLVPMVVEIAIIMSVKDFGRFLIKLTIV